MNYVRAFKINKLECIQMGVTYQFDILMTLFSNGLDIYRDSSIFTLKLHIAGKSCRDWMRYLPKLFEHLNGIVAKGFHRRHEIEDQIIENFNYHRYANQMVNSLESVVDPTAKNARVCLRDNTEFKRKSMFNCLY
jgi:hypothetical protein